MVRSKLIFSLLVITAFCAVAVPSFAKPAPNQIRGAYGFGGMGVEGWIGTDAAAPAFTGVLFVSGGWGGTGFGELICNDGDGDETISDVLATYFINPINHQGNFWFISGGDAFCDDDWFLTLDAQVTKGGSLIKFNFAGDANIGDDVVGAGNMERLAMVTPSGIYGLLLRGQDDNDHGIAGTGYLTLQTDVNGNVMIQNGEIDCNHDGSSYVSSGFHCSDCVTLNLDGTGMMFLTSSGGDDICGSGDKGLVLDFVIVNKGARLLANANAMWFLPNTNRENAGSDRPLYFELDLQ